MLLYTALRHTRERQQLNDRPGRLSLFRVRWRRRYSRDSRSSAFCLHRVTAGRRPRSVPEKWWVRTNGDGDFWRSPLPTPADFFRNPFLRIACFFFTGLDAPKRVGRPVWTGLASSKNVRLGVALIFGVWGNFFCFDFPVGVGKTGLVEFDIDTLWSGEGVWPWALGLFARTHLSSIGFPDCCVVYFYQILSEAFLPFGCNNCFFLTGPVECG